MVAAGSSWRPHHRPPQALGFDHADELKACHDARGAVLRYVVWSDVVGVFRKCRHTPRRSTAAAVCSSGDPGTGAGALLAIDAHSVQQPFEGPKVNDEHRLPVRASIEPRRADPLWIVRSISRGIPSRARLRSAVRTTNSLDYSANRFAMQAGN